MIDVHQNAALSESFEGDRSRVIGNRCNFHFFGRSTSSLWGSKYWLKLWLKIRIQDPDLKSLLEILIKKPVLDRLKPKSYGLDTFKSPIAIVRKIRLVILSVWTYRNWYPETGTEMSLWEGPSLATRKRCRIVESDDSD